MSRRRGNPMLKLLKDYAVPIVGVLLLAVLMYSFLLGGSSTEPQKEEKETSSTPGLSLKQNNGSIGKIALANGKEIEIITDTKLHAGEELRVKEGDIQIDATDADFRVDRHGKIRYIKEGSYKVSSGKVWIHAKKDIQVKMSFLTLDIKKDSYVSLFQSEVASKVHMVHGSTKVTSNAGTYTMLGNNKEISLSSKNSQDESFDIELQKEGLSEVFLKSDWFVLNDGQSQLNKETTDSETTASGTTETEETTSETPQAVEANNNMLTFDNLIDGSQVSASTINITGKYEDASINKIEVNGTKATLNKEIKKFQIENVDTSNKTTDLVFKVYNKSGVLINRFVYSVGYKNANSNKKTGIYGKLKTYEANASKFVFTSPSASGVYSTAGDGMLVQGKVSESGVDKVTINGYKLSSFKGSTWKYNAVVAGGNLKKGSNIYTVQYYKGNTVVFENQFIIVKQ